LRSKDVQGGKDIYTLPVTETFLFGITGRPISMKWKAIDW